MKILTTYIHFEDSRIYILLALWIIASYLYSTFSYFGYLFFHSAVMRSGKTRALEILSHLAFNATSPLNAPTPATLREYAVEGGTVQLDTLERWKQKSTESYAAAMDILDAAFRKGGTVTKMVPGTNGNWRKEEYPVYAPLTMAGINKESLSDTALDRCLMALNILASGCWTTLFLAKWTTPASPTPACLPKNDFPSLPESGDTWLQGSRVSPKSRTSAVVDLTFQLGR